MAITIAGNFNLTSALPLDNRCVVDTLADLYDGRYTGTNAYKGMQVYVTEEDAYYKLNTELGTSDTVTSIDYWSEITSLNNSPSVDSALKDGDGNIITDTYLPLVGGRIIDSETSTTQYIDIYQDNITITDGDWYNKIMSSVITIKDNEAGELANLTPVNLEFHSNTGEGRTDLGAAYIILQQENASIVIKANTADGSEISFAPGVEMEATYPDAVYTTKIDDYNLTTENVTTTTLTVDELKASNIVHKITDQRIWLNGIYDDQDNLLSENLGIGLGTSDSLGIHIIDNLYGGDIDYATNSTTGVRTATLNRNWYITDEGNAYFDELEVQDKTTLHGETEVVGYANFNGGLIIASHKITEYEHRDSTNYGVAIYGPYVEFGSSATIGYTTTANSNDGGSYLKFSGYSIDLNGANDSKIEFDGSGKINIQPGSGSNVVINDRNGTNMIQVQNDTVKLRNSQGTNFLISGTTIASETEGISFTNKAGEDIYLLLDRTDLSGWKVTNVTGGDLVIQTDGLITDGVESKNTAFADVVTFDLSEKEIVIADDWTLDIGQISGNASSATKLATARTIQTNLASTSAASFDGTSNITPGVTGILGIANGGTGTTTGHIAITQTDDTTSTASPGVSGTFTAIDSITRDTYGHVTTVNTKTITMPTDTKVTNTLATTTKAYITGTSTATTNTGTQIFDTGVYLDSVAGRLYTTSLSIAGAGIFTGSSSTVSLSTNLTVTETVEATTLKGSLSTDYLTSGEEELIIDCGNATA